LSIFVSQVNVKYVVKTLLFYSLNHTMKFLLSYQNWLFYYLTLFSFIMTLCG